MKRKVELDLIKSAIRANFAIAEKGIGMFPVVYHKGEDNEYSSYEDSPHSASASFMIVMMESGYSIEEVEHELGLSSEEFRQMKSSIYDVDPLRLQIKIKLCRNYIRLSKKKYI